MDVAKIEQTYGYDVLIQTDEEKHVTAINSSAFVSGEGWTVVDHGEGDKYHHAQGNYLQEPLVDKYGRYLWRLKRKKIERIPDEELPVPDPEPSLEEENKLLKAQLQAITERSEFVEDCLAELAGIIYG